MANHGWKKDIDLDSRNSTPACTIRRLANGLRCECIPPFRCWIAPSRELELLYVPTYENIGATQIYLPCPLKLWINNGGSSLL